MLLGRLDLGEVGRRESLPRCLRERLVQRADSERADRRGAENVVWRP